MKHEVSRNRSRMDVFFSFSSLAILFSLAAGIVGCTGQIPNSFRLLQQEQNFKSEQKVNTKIDLLWVVGNSAGMDVAQQRLRNGFASFANSYLKPYWDIRLAVITTDTYLANPAFSGYLGRTISAGSVGYTSPYISGRIGTWVNPSWNPSLVDGTGTFTAGIKYGELVPVWNSDFSKLLAGNHDGPITGLCNEWLPYFLLGPTACSGRDLSTRSAADRISDCVNASGDSSQAECINTVQNDKVRSGHPIIHTKDYSNTSDLIHDFMLNASVGSIGQGSHRGFSSVLQLMNDNEASASTTKFFRKGSLRGIVFVAYKEDQSMDLPNPAPSGFAPETDQFCDKTTLDALNLPDGKNVQTMGICCTGGSCKYNAASRCSEKTVANVGGGSVTYRPSFCANPAKLLSLASVKTQFDTFFQTLDENPAGDANYFSAAIVALSGETITDFQARRNAIDAAVGQIKNQAVDRADRYVDFGTLVGNGSMSLDIGDSDYSTLLAQIGDTIIAKKSKFTLDREPTGSEDMVVTIKHGDGTSTTVSSSDYTVSGKVLTLTSVPMVLSLTDTDTLSVSYQPKTVY